MWRWGWILREGESCVRVETGTSLCSSNLSPSPSCETSSPQPGAPSPQHGDHHLRLSHHHLRVGAIPSSSTPTISPIPERLRKEGRNPRAPSRPSAPFPPPQAPPLPARRREGAGPGGAGGSQRDGGGAAPFPHCPALSRPGRVSIRPGPRAVTTAKPGGGRRRRLLARGCRPAGVPAGGRGRSPGSGCVAFPFPRLWSVLPSNASSSKVGSAFLYCCCLFVCYFMREFAVSLRGSPPERHVCGCPSGACCMGGLLLARSRRGRHEVSRSDSCKQLVSECGKNHSELRLCHFLMAMVL